MSEHNAEKINPVSSEFMTVMELVSHAWSRYFTEPIGTEEEMTSGLIQVLATSMQGTPEQFERVVAIARATAWDLHTLEEQVGNWHS